jgi:hypothetical protein
MLQELFWPVLRVQTRNDNLLTIQEALVAHEKGLVSSLGAGNLTALQMIDACGHYQILEVMKRSHVGNNNEKLQ